VRPLIGITSYARGGTRLSFSVPCEYIDAIRRAGGVPVVLPPVLGPVREALDVVSGLIFPGGGDIHPEHYGGNDHDANYGTCHERDAFELVMARAALDRDMPIMCVCRGMQVLNVARGGTLHQHLPDVVGETVTHRQPGNPSRPTHAVSVAGDSRLAGILGRTEAQVNSFHHQACAVIGDRLTVTARAEDGTVEGFEAPDRGFMVGVQWHAECLVDHDEHVALFSALVEACVERALATAPTAFAAAGSA